MASAHNNERATARCKGSPSPLLHSAPVHTAEQYGTQRARDVSFFRMTGLENLSLGPTGLVESKLQESGAKRLDGTGPRIAKLQVSEI